MESEKQAYIHMHIAVILFGFTAILGALIDLPALTIVWWRVLITSVSLLVFVKWGKKAIELEKKDILRFSLIGSIVGLHWLCFYGSIKLANSSIALICMATTALFTSILEPLVIKSRHSLLDIVIGIVIIPAMIFIVNTTDISLRWGIIIGLISAFLASTFSVFNKKYIHKADFYTITFIELSAATIILTFVIPFVWSNNTSFRIIPPELEDWIYLLILALACTTLAYVLALRSLRYISAFNSNLIINLEPVYGIVMAIFILQEHRELNLSFYMGCLIILAAVFTYPFLKKKFGILR